MTTKYLATTINAHKAHRPYVEQAYYLLVWGVVVTCVREFIDLIDVHDGAAEFHVVGHSVDD